MTSLMSSVALAVIEPTTSTELDTPPYSEFKCYKHQLPRFFAFCSFQNVFLGKH